MSDSATPWYVRWVIGIGGWVTSIVLLALGAAIVFALLRIESIAALAYFGAAVFAAGVGLSRQASNGIFAKQLGIATTAAGAAMVAIGSGGAAEQLWVAFIASTLMLSIVVVVCNEKILQFLTAVLALGCYVAAVLDSQSGYALDLIALATPLGLLLVLFPPQRDLMPTAVAALMTFPVFSILPKSGMFWTLVVEQRGTFARMLHILLFLGLVGLHLRSRLWTKPSINVVAFAVVAVLICLLLSPGGSAAMLILMLAFVIGSRPLALLGVTLQINFIVRYYYELEMNLFDKSLLMMAVGVLLIFTWWLLSRTNTESSPS